MKYVSTIIFLAFVTLIAYLLYTMTLPRMDKYNKHMCAVAGYKADCKTPLPESEKLK